MIQRTCDVMNQLKTDDPAKIRAAGVIDLETFQRYLNFHFSVTIDLFGADESSNAAIFYNSGPRAASKRPSVMTIIVCKARPTACWGAGWQAGRAPGADAQRAERSAARRLHQGFDRRRQPLEQGHRKAGIPFRLTTPHKAFNRKIGTLSGVKVSPMVRGVGRRMGANEKHWLPSAEDRAFVASLMGRVVEPGQFANWIAPPVMGINRQQSTSSTCASTSAIRGRLAARIAPRVQPDQRRFAG